MSLHLGLVGFGVIFTIMFQPSNGQFPTACMDDTSLQDRTCCPDDCGASSNRGTCTNINIAIPTGQYDSTTVRDNWPYTTTQMCANATVTTQDLIAAGASMATMETTAMKRWTVLDAYF